VYEFEKGLQVPVSAAGAQRGLSGSSSAIVLDPPKVRTVQGKPALFYWGFHTVGDYKSYFLIAIGRDAMRIYRMGQFTGAIDRKLGYAKFPEPAEITFYEAAAGCPNPSGEVTFLAGSNEKRKT
jgi:hypothetical protein